MLAVRTDEVSLSNLQILLLPLAASIAGCTVQIILIVTVVRLIVLVGERLYLHAVEHDLLLFVRTARLRVLAIVVLLSHLFFFSGYLLL